MALEEEKAGDVPVTAALNPARVLGEGKAGDVPAPAAMSPAMALGEEKRGDVPPPAALNSARALGDEKAGYVPVVLPSPRTRKGKAPAAYNLAIKARMKTHLT